MYIRTLPILAATLGSWVTSYEAEKAKFIKALEEHPQHALAWSAGMFDLSAKYTIASYYLGQIKDREIAEAGGTGVPSEAQVLRDIRTVALLRTAEGARRPNRNNDTHGMIERAEVAAWAELLAAFGPLDNVFSVED